MKRRDFLKASTGGSTAARRCQCNLPGMLKPLASQVIERKVPQPGGAESSGKSRGFRVDGRRPTTIRVHTTSCNATSSGSTTRAIPSRTA